MKLINLTPHKINIYGENKKLILSIKPENVPARCAQKKKIYGYVGEIPVYCMTFGEIESLRFLLLRRRNLSCCSLIITAHFTSV